MIGPIVAAAVLAGGGAASTGLLITGALASCGVAGLAASPYGHVKTSASTDQPATRQLTSGRLRRPFVLLLGTIALFGAGNASTFVGIASIADHAGQPALAGGVEACAAIGAVVGALAWTHVSRGGQSSVQLAGLLAYVAIADVIAATQVDRDRSTRHPARDGRTCGRSGARRRVHAHRPANSHGCADTRIRLDKHGQ